MELPALEGPCPIFWEFMASLNPDADAHIFQHILAFNALAQDSLQMQTETQSSGVLLSPWSQWLSAETVHGQREHLWELFLCPWMFPDPVP